MSVAHVVGDAVVVTIAGDVDMASVAAVRAALDDIACDQRVVLDCAGVTFMDSSGLSLLATLWARMQECGGSLRVRKPSAPVRRVMELTGLHDLITR